MIYRQSIGKQVAKLKVQAIQTDRGVRHLLLQDDFSVVKDVYLYLKYLDATGKSPNTIKSYAYHLKTYYEFCLLKNADPLLIFKSETRKPIDFLCDFILWLQYPEQASGIACFNGESPIRSNATVNIIVSTVLAFYQYLSANNVLDELPVYKIQRQSITYKPMLYEMVRHDIYKKKSLLKKPTASKQVKAITRAQYMDMLKLCRTRRDCALLALMYEGGLRISETLGIHVSDLDELESGIVKIVPRENNENGARVKNYAGGIIKLPDYAVDILLDYMCADLASFNSDFLFINLSGPNIGYPLKVDTVEQLFKRFSQQLGYNVHPHMLRHGFATEKLEAGWQMIDIQKYLRHKSISSTQIYATYSDDLKKRKMADFLEMNNIQMKEIADVLREEKGK